MNTLDYGVAARSCGSALSEPSNAADAWWVALTNFGRPLSASRVVSDSFPKIGTARGFVAYSVDPNFVRAWQTRDSPGPDDANFFEPATLG